MSNESKMDRQGVRTPAQLEQKYNFGKSFAEIMGIATDAQEAANNAASSADELDKKLTSQEIFNRLTENGTLQGLYRDEKGNLYINAEFIQAVDKLFAKDINMSGKFTYTASVFIEPSATEVEVIRQHLLGNVTIPAELIPLYDSNNDGKITITDLGDFNMASLGQHSLANWSGAKKSAVTLTIDLTNPNKALRITGTTMWGKSFDRYIGVNGTNIKNPEIADYIVEQGTSGIWHYKKYASGECELYGTTTRNIDFSSLTDIIGRSDPQAETLPFIVKNQCISVDCDDINVWASCGPKHDASVTFVFWRKWAYRSHIYTIHIQVKGTWK